MPIPISEIEPLGEGLIPLKICNHDLTLCPSVSVSTRHNTDIGTRYVFDMPVWSQT